MFGKNYTIGVKAYIGGMRVEWIEDDQPAFSQTDATRPCLSSYEITPYVAIGGWTPHLGAKRRLSFHSTVEAGYTSAAASLRAAQGKKGKSFYSSEDDPAMIAAAVLHHCEFKAPNKTMHALEAYAQASLYARIKENNADILKPRHTDDASSFNDSVDRLLLVLDHDIDVLDGRDLEISVDEAPAEMERIRETAKTLCVAFLGPARVETFEAHFDRFYQDCRRIGFFE